MFQVMVAQAIKYLRPHANTTQVGTPTAPQTPDEEIEISTTHASKFKVASILNTVIIS